MVILRNFKNIFLVAELRKKLLFTLGILFVTRIGAKIPVIGIDVVAVRESLSRMDMLGGLLSYLDIFSGGALSQCTLFALGIGPYISASIMMQMLGFAVPYFEQLLKEGEYGRRIINQYTRYLAFALSVFYSTMYAFYVEAQGLVLTPGWSFRLMFIVSLVTGALFVMWLAEQISLFGIGNGSSMVIFSSIVARFPDDFFRTIYAVRQGQLDVVLAIVILTVFLGVIGCIVFLEKGERKIPVQYARRVIGNRMYGGQSTYIPFKINTPGVMPVIFTSTVLNFPRFILGLLAPYWHVFKVMYDHFSYVGFVYNAFQFFLIVFFSYFYTALIYNPEQVADNIKKNGGFVPGIRPGRKTTDFFTYILNRIGLVGAIYLAGLALLPNIMAAFITMPFYITGTSLLIAVGVAMETSVQIESFLIERKYEGFLTSGRMRGRGGR